MKALYAAYGVHRIESVLLELTNRTKLIQGERADSI